MTNLPLISQLTAQQQSLPEEEEYEWVEEVRMVPQETMVEEVGERVEEVYVTEQKELPTVTSRYPFQGQGMHMNKGEVSCKILFSSLCQYVVAIFCLRYLCV